MSNADTTLAYVRTEDAPKLPAPPSTVGVQGWLLKNLFSTPFYSALTIVLGAIMIWLIADILSWALLSAVWVGTDREACLGENTGACWPMVFQKFPQWIYGFYPIDQRWRVNIVYVTAIAAMIPMLMPSAPHKAWNALLLIMVFPLLTFILLTGGNLAFSSSTYRAMATLLLLGAILLPFAAYGLEEGVARNKLGLGLALAASSFWVISFLVPSPQIGIFGLRLDLFPIVTLLLAIGSSLFSIIVTGARGRSTLISWAITVAAIFAVMLLLDIDFGLVEVETTQWGGLLVTLVVAVTGIVASLPIGILLALGRRSKMPVIKLFSVVFIELWRGVPLITVLFMSSVMLPLFMPVGVNFDKLLRALIGIGLFSSAYMAEVVRSGLQAIPKGQYEGAMALGLSYWQSMAKIILPQALKISIPNIVGNFISLFKDTTLVSIIGLFDLLLIVRTSLKDANWSTPATTPTGYFTLAAMFWVFCFSMSRYSMYTERRLNTGHKR